MAPLPAAPDRRADPAAPRAPAATPPGAAAAAGDDADSRGSLRPPPPQAGLATALEGPGPFTVFAPNDDVRAQRGRLVARPAWLRHADSSPTHFCPHNSNFTRCICARQAFIALTKALKISKVDLMNLPNLGDILKYHVLAGKVTSADLVEGAEVETLLGQKLTVSLKGAFR